MKRKADIVVKEGRKGVKILYVRKRGNLMLKLNNHGRRLQLRRAGWGQYVENEGIFGGL